MAISNIDPENQSLIAIEITKDRKNILGNIFDFLQPAIIVHRKQLFIQSYQMDRDVFELLDAYSSLGIKPIKSEELSAGSVNIFLGGIHQETLTIAKAVSARKDIYSEKINIIMGDLENRGIFMFDGSGFSLCRHPERFDYGIYTNQFKASVYGDSPKFEKYSEEKYLTGIILRMKGIRVPDEVVFRKRHNVSGSNISSLEKMISFASDDTRFVLKPSSGSSGKGVKVISRAELGESFYDKHIRGKDTMLLQEKIDSYPIFIGGKRKDWNLRGIITFDDKSKKYVFAGMIGRIDNDGGPVNISISAEYISFGEIARLSGWDEKLADSIRKKVEDISIRSVRAISERIARNKDKTDLWVNHQDISGVDVIIGENLEPVILEVNPANSGGIYRLMKDEGLEVVYPIADSILAKTMLVSRVLEYSHENTTPERKDELERLIRSGI